MTAVAAIATSSIARRDDSVGGASKSSAGWPGVELEIESTSSYRLFRMNPAFDNTAQTSQCASTNVPIRKSNGFAVRQRGCISDPGELFCNLKGIHLKV
jgi:hypothetical protein